MPDFFKYLFFVAAFFISTIACNETSNHSIPDNKNGLTDLNAVQSSLPDVPGYETFKMNCISCHSARYITMQPDLPEKTWATIVTKMQKNFGAPIADSAAEEIVQYLISIKGKK